MEEALKKMAHKPNLKEINERSTFSKRLSARLSYGSTMRGFTKMKSAIKGPSVVDMTFLLTKTHNWTIFYGALVLGLSFYSSVVVTMARKETFQRSYPQIEKKYGEKHREAFGEDARINRLGYPDMGNNLFADQMPYKEWMAMNNAQRMHESGYEYTFVFLPNAFITALTLPRTATYVTGAYAFSRFCHINGYTNVRGYNSAMIHEELMRFELIVMLGAAFVSSIRIMAGMRLGGKGYVGEALKSVKSSIFKRAKK